MDQLFGLVGGHFLHQSTAAGQFAFAPGDDGHDASALVALVDIGCGCHGEPPFRSVDLLGKGESG